MLPDTVAHWKRKLGSGLAGNTIQPLIDGPEAFTAIQRAIESADKNGHFIYLLAWWCDPWVNLTGPRTCLLDLLARAGRRGVQIRALLWDAPWVPGFFNQSRLNGAAVAALNRLPNCHAQLDNAGLTKSHHQKLLVVKGRDGLVALCGGVDINADRLHQLPPPRRAYRADRPSDVGWIGGSGGSGSGAGGTGDPLHDVHARVSGPSATWLLQAFLLRWWARSGDRAIDRRAPLKARWWERAPETGAQYARVGRTFNGNVQRPGERRARRAREVQAQDIWLRAILGARRFIYMEEQYLTHLCAAEAIRSVLPRLEHVTILIPPSEMTDMSGIWRRRREFIGHITRGNPHAAKLHVYTRALRPVGPSCRRRSGPHLYVHSKMAVIDDDLLLIGSANCNHRGWETDSELVVAAFEQSSAGVLSTAQRLRMALWSHHLDVPPSAVRDPVRSRGYWDGALGTTSGRGGRHVCRYDPTAGSDGVLTLPDSIVDPTDRRQADPCCTLLQICP